ncbi:MAG: RNA methyltransferase [Deltaproteobacteria bacterium]|nr:RNA methyltransferase [Deltaproteobacteria bacterium]
MARYFATTAKGIESITAEELKRLGAENIEQSFGGVYFEGANELLYRANLHLRTATRVLMPIREFAAKTPEMLYDQVRRIKWENYLNPQMTFAVDCTIAGSKTLRRTMGAENLPRPRLPGDPEPLRERLNNSRFAALKVKDAIVDQLRQKQGARPNVDAEQPDIQVVAYLHGGRCILSLDSSGVSLHERGYRLRDAGAPLKETLAAAIIELSGWDTATPFIDPMCGSGTLPLEAGLTALKIAPGLFRERFGFFSWPDFDEALWTRVVDEARAKINRRIEAPILGFDQDRDAIATALENSKRAGLTKLVHFEKRGLESLAPVGDKPGTLIVNPPYGVRLGEVEELKSLYTMLGDLFKQRMKGYTAFIFTGNLELAKQVGLRAARRIELFNGPIDCRLLKYDLY